MLTAIFAAICIAVAFRRADIRRTDDACADRALLEVLSGPEGVSAPWRRRGNGYVRTTSIERLRSDLGKIVRALPPSPDQYEAGIDRLLRCRRRGWIDLYYYRVVGPPTHREICARLTDEGRQALLRMRQRVELPAPTARLLS